MPCSVSESDIPAPHLASTAQEKVSAFLLRFYKHFCYVETCTVYCFGFSCAKLLYMAARFQ